jgi:hypothetical protein
MFEFLKNIASKAGGKLEAQRARVERALGEINSVLAELDVKPKLDGAVKSRFTLCVSRSIFWHDYITR